MAEVEVGGVSRNDQRAADTGSHKDDYVLVHAGFAIHVIDEAGSPGNAEALRGAGRVGRAREESKGL